MAKKAKMPVEKLNKPVPVTIVDRPSTSRISDDKAYEDRERKYRAKSALDDIERAEAHKRDKGLMKDVKACAKEKMKAYDKL